MNRNKDSDDSRRLSQSRGPQLRWRIVLLLLMVSLLPLTLVSLGAWQTFSTMLEQASLEHQRTIVNNHALAIESHLLEQRRILEFAAHSHGLAELTQAGRLQWLFDTLSKTHTFVDLGVIDSHGQHLAYVGPYELESKDYSKAEWFTETRAKDSYISDVFLGYRQVPHCVVAIKRIEGADWWILRATINSDRFDQLVRTGAVGHTGDAFILNAKGQYQTQPKVGQVLGQSPIGALPVHRGVRHERLEGANVIRATRWMNDERWVLVVQQDASEILAPLRQAMVWGGLVVGLGVALLAFAATWATRFLTREIEAAEARRDELSRDLMRSAKLASLGELASGLAHEINNPLAIIGAEQTNIADLAILLKGSESDRNELLSSVETSKRQVQRCGAITARMLQFGRQTDSNPVHLDVADSAEDIIQLVQKQAQIRNVMLRQVREGPLPTVLVDPTEFQQVLINLLNNALYATKKGGEITICTRPQDGGVLLEVRDTGTGIEPEVLGRIFQPFFTTKPVGKGTGLGLSVCFGIVHTWKGILRAESKVGEGTVVSVWIPPMQPKTAVGHC
ncbi:MAG: hypothetical protein HN348_20955 [Proteobacteria bacterium]|jgi:two-component system, NtrC family, sensor kinase|nr:hypothetical protein [Pseudomonadota bacterium]